MSAFNFFLKTLVADTPTFRGATCNYLQEKKYRKMKHEDTEEV